jgi:anti-anti-sigma factor
MSAVQTQVSSEHARSTRETQFGNPGLIVTVSKERRSRIVHLSGELDIATRSVARDACIVGDDHDVVVDLGELTFMDSRGYDALTSARDSLRRRGVTMTLRNLGGQPARLIGLLSVFEAQAGHGRPERSWSASTSVAWRQVVSAGFNGSALG